MQSKELLKETLIILALCVNYTCAFALALFLHLEIPYFIVTVLIFSFLAGSFLPSMGRKILSVGLSIVAGAALTIVLYVAPLVVYGETWMVDLVLLEVLTFVVPHLLFGALFSLLGSVMGTFLGDALK